jgi:hypothetical protein
MHKNVSVGTEDVKAPKLKKRTHKKREQRAYVPAVSF